MRFSMFESVSFYIFRFLRERRFRSWSIIRNTEWKSTLSLRAISVGVEWVSGWTFWLRIISSTSLMLSSVHTDLGRQELSFPATWSISSIFFNSFFAPFTFHSYSGWSLTILVAPYLHLVWRYLRITFFLYENTISVSDNNLI